MVDKNFVEYPYQNNFHKKMILYIAPQSFQKWWPKIITGYYSEKNDQNIAP